MNEKNLIKKVKSEIWNDIKFGIFIISMLVGFMAIGYGVGIEIWPSKTIIRYDSNTHCIGELTM